MPTKYRRLGGLKPPTAIQAKAARTLRKETRRMLNDYAGGVLTEAQARSWQTRFAEIADTMADAISKDMVKYSKRNIESSLGAMASALTVSSYTTPKIQDIIDRHTTDMVGYIRSIPTEYHDKIKRAVIDVEGDAEKLKSVIKDIGHSTESRAEFIARDQISKFNGALNTARMDEAGIKRVMWRHSGGSGTPRPLHVEYDGQIFDLDDPPVIDEDTGERGWAGDLINCRCFMVPVIEERTA